MMHFLSIAAALGVATALPTTVQQRDDSDTYSTSKGATVDTYAELCVLHHNYHRANHSAPAVTWDDDLAATAKKIADECSFEHKMDFDGGNYGQNLAAGVLPANITEIITGLWYNAEEILYPSYGRNPTDDEMAHSFHLWGHFTQMVWKDTTIIGCWTSDCTNNGGVNNTGSNVLPFLTVCNYKGPGNYEGEFADQVGESVGNGTIQWDYGLEDVSTSAATLESEMKTYLGERR